VRDWSPMISGAKASKAAHDQYATIPKKFYVVQNGLFTQNT
jgi:hypothetical protein